MTTIAAEGPGDLKRVGIRGVVIHEGLREAGTYAYFADNTSESWRASPVNVGKFAEQRGISQASLDAIVNAGAPVAFFAADAKPRTVFLNLDAFHDLGRSVGGKVPSAGPRPGAGEDAVLIQENKSFYAVPLAALHPLDAANAGEAKILVRRGAISAGIPDNDIPYGTNCVLVNLTQLLP